MLTPLAEFILPVSLFQLKAHTFKGMCPWSWYMATTPSNCPHLALAQTESGGTVDVETTCCQFLDGGNDFLSLLPTEHAVFAAVWIQTCHTDVGLLDAELSASIVNEFHALDDAGLFHQIAGLSQRNVRRYMDDADILVGQHHGILLGVGKRGIDFRMSVVMVTSQVQRFLVERCCHRTVHLVSHGQFNGLPYILEGGIITLGLHLAELEGGKIDTFQVNNVDGAVFELSILHVLDGINLQVKAKQLNGLAHDGSIACNDGTTLLVSLFSVQGTYRYLRTYACGVAHGDS